ncbi:tail completion or Neck1 protein [Escherichia phage HK639]|uniref:tail completion or Neck1 protein n=1 Tax=Escherichia phage HK639 TaxID=906669 RepID=UPI00022FB460|nr:tail completion or Neck1 protein [Escherichia phage HK639]ADO67694.1 unknown [Escherichia phage HK639]
MASTANQPFLAAIQLFVDSSKEEVDEVVRRTGIKILAQLVEMSPIGNPDLWQVNQTASAYNDAVREHNANLRDNPANLTKAGRLKRGLRVNDSMDIKKPEGYVGGRFKNNWYVGFDSQPTETNDTPDASGQGSNSRGLAVLEVFRVGQVNSIYFTNNLPYAAALENGHSTQAPGGMVGITAIDAAQLFREAMSEVRNGR